MDRTKRYLLLAGLGAAVAVAQRWIHELVTSWPDSAVPDTELEETEAEERETDGADS